MEVHGLLLVLSVAALVMEVAGLSFLGWLVHKVWQQTQADDAAIFLQGRRVEEILREMRQLVRERLG